MADGSRKAIKNVRVGDKVESTDLVTGTTSARRVTRLHDNHDTDLTVVTVRIGKGHTFKIETTQHHLFWDDTHHAWTSAASLGKGDRLHIDKAKTTATVVAVRNHTGSREMRDLTVDTTHTYYVMAGTTPVLVHNTGCGGIVSSAQSVDENVAGLSGLQNGDGLSGVYDPQSGTLEARLSSGPNALVNRFGGHGTINSETFGGSSETVGFVAIVRDGGLEVRWNSGSVNAQNFGSAAAPMEYRGAIMDELSNITGLNVWSG